MRIPIYFQRETRDPLHVTGCMHLVGEILERSVWFGAIQEMQEAKRSKNMSDAQSRAKWSRAPAHPPRYMYDVPM